MKKSMRLSIKRDTVHNMKTVTKGMKRYLPYLESSQRLPVREKKNKKTGTNENIHKQ